MQTRSIRGSGACAKSGPACCSLRCFPRFYELILLVAAPLVTYHYTNDFRASLMAFVFSGLFVVLADTAFQPQPGREEVDAAY
jgi:hypothetical protein